MDYKLPDVRNLDMGQLNDYRAKIVNHLKLVNEEIQKMVYVECTLCETPEYTRGTPNGWGWLLSHPGYLLCKYCIAKWKRIHGEEPKIFKEGDKLSG